MTITWTFLYNHRHWQSDSCYPFFLAASGSINFVCVTGKAHARLCVYLGAIGLNKNEMNGVSGHDFALIRLYWAGDNLG